MVIRNYLAAIVLLITMHGCKVDEAPPALALTNGSYKDWQYYRFEVEGFEVDELPLCQTDDKWRFYNNGKLEINVMGTQCAGVVNPQEIVVSNWEMSEAQDSMILHSSLPGIIAPPVYGIFKLTEREFVLQLHLSDADSTFSVSRIFFRPYPN